MDTIYGILAPGGKLIMVLMPKKCIWEQIYFLLKGDFKRYKRRNTEQALLVNVDGIQVPTWYFNPDEIIEISKKKYTKTNCVPIGITVPPSYFEKSVLTKTPVWNVLKIIEKKLSNNFLSKYADHFLIELTKK